MTGQDEVAGFRLLGGLGEGGVARVYRAVRENGPRPGEPDELALKILKPEAVDQQHVVASFQYEIRVLSRLDHPGIMGLHDSGATKGVAWAAVDLVDGTPYDAYLKDRKKLPEAEAARHGAGLLDALAHMHDRGYVHRDLKPGNLMLHDDRLVVMDFGTVVKANTSITYEDGLYGTVPYLSPEQVRQDSTLSDRSDIYSVGVVLYRMVTGEWPFLGLREDILRSHVGKPAPRAAKKAKISDGLDAAIDRALAKSADDRPSASELAEELRELAAAAPAPKKGLRSRLFGG